MGVVTCLFYGSTTLKLVPLHAVGAASIRQCHILNDKRHVITKDSKSNVDIYDVLSARLVENLGPVSLEEEIKKRTQTVFVPNWFTVDLKIGVSLD